jgi:hypothetical protein
VLQEVRCVVFRELVLSVLHSEGAILDLLVFIAAVFWVVR